VTWPAALAWTLAVEASVVVTLALARGWARGSRLGLVALAALGASLMTQPPAWLADRELAAALAPGARWLLLESVVTAVEAAAYVLVLRLSARRALAASVLSNAASFGVGLVLQSIGHR
jgi:hypothetical protein